MKTTLQEIKSLRPSRDEWNALLKHLGKTEADNDPISLSTILNSNGFVCALWYLRAVAGYDREKRLFSIFCAKQISHLKRSRLFLNALEVAERYANGLATDEELDDAVRAAERATYAKEEAARVVSRAAFYRAVRTYSYPYAAVKRAAIFADAYGANAYFAHASRAAREQPAQIEEFLRMIKCVENGDRYTI